MSLLHEDGHAEGNGTRNTDIHQQYGLHIQSAPFTSVEGANGEAQQMESPMNDTATPSLIQDTSVATDADDDDSPMPVPRSRSLTELSPSPYQSGSLSPSASPLAPSASEANHASYGVNRSAVRNRQLAVESSGEDDDEDIDVSDDYKPTPKIVTINAETSENSDDEGHEESSARSESPAYRTEYPRRGLIQRGNLAKTQHRRSPEAYFLEDPELYGLRRSGRAKHQPHRLEEDLTAIAPGRSRLRKSIYAESSDSDEASSRRSRGSRARDTRYANKYGFEDDEVEEEESDEVDDSDDDFGGRKGTRKARRRLTIPKSSHSRRSKASNSSPSEFVRFSTRNKTRANYNEDENDYGLESEEELTDGQFARAGTGTPEVGGEEEEEVIELVCDHRRGGDYDNASDSDDPESNIEYLVKWKGQSHLHDTWSTYPQLKQSRGWRKVDNYIQRNIVEEQNFRSHPETTKEQIEQWDINLERRREELIGYRTVERVIAMRERQEFNEETQTSYPVTEYFCKWKGLYYDECTWENEDLISSDFQSEIDAFLDRDQSQLVPHRSNANNIKNRSKFTPLREQPDYIVGGQLRDYQLHGINWMAYLWSKNQNGILADEMGLGKTVQTIGFLSYFFHHQQLYGPFLVVVPLSTVDNWMTEFRTWAPDMNAVCYIGNRQAREVIRDFEFFQPYASGAPGNPKRPKFNVLITTYEIVLKDREQLGMIRWAFLAVDEAHRLKNSESQLHEALRDFTTQNRLLITGTPLQNNIKELLSLVKFLMPDMEMPELELNFDTNSSTTATAEDAKDQEEKIRLLHERLKPLMLRRLKKDVEKSLPNKSERILRVECSPLQMHYYKHILTKNFEALTKSADKQKKQWLNIAMELKKASNHPYLFPDAEQHSEEKAEQLKGLVVNSGKMMLLDKLLARLKEAGHRVLIFSQFVMMLDILSDYMALRGHPYQRLDGSMKPEQRNKAIEHYNAPGSPDFVFLLSTRAGGMGINLVTADTVIIFDSDWNPQNDLQAMSRAHRIGQTKSVNVYRFVSKGTIEEDIIERAKRKMVLEYCIIKQMDTSGLSLYQQKAIADVSAQMEAGSSGKKDNLPFAKDELSTILKFGAQNMFQQQDSNTAHKLEDVDLDDILARAETTQTIEAEGGSLGGEDFLAQFQIADYGGDLSAMSWDDIIPKEERAKFEAEARVKQQEELFARAAKKRSKRYDEHGLMNGSSETQDDSAKKKRRKTGANVSSGAKRKASGPADVLTEKDLRALIRGILQFGSIHDRYDDIVTDTDLQHKDGDVVTRYAVGLISACEDALASYKASNGAAGDEEQEDGGKPKGKAKACLFTWEGIHSVNAGQIISRSQDLTALTTKLSKLKDLEKFRLSVPLKSVGNWSCTWGQREDAMLLVGIYKYGFGNWVKMQNDKNLGLGQKFFLSAAGDEEDGADDKKSPKAIHLVRRGEYLLKTFRENENRKASQTVSKSQSNAPAKKSVKSKIKPASSSTARKETVDSPSHAPSPARNVTKAEQEAKLSPRDSSTKRSQKNKAKSVRSAEQVEDNDSDLGSDHSNYESFNEKECKSVMKPVKTDLKKLKHEAGDYTGSEKAHFIRECLKAIGDRITEVVEAEPEETRNKRRRHLWYFTKHFFPNPNISSKSLLDLYKRIGQSSSKPTSSSATSSTRKPNSSDSISQIKREVDDPDMHNKRHRNENGDEARRGRDAKRSRDDSRERRTYSTSNSRRQHSSERLNKEHRHSRSRERSRYDERHRDSRRDDERSRERDRDREDERERRDRKRDGERERREHDRVHSHHEDTTDHRSH